MSSGGGFWPQRRSRQGSLAPHRDACFARPNLSKRQEELKAKHKLSATQFEDMLEMLAGLTLAERATLKDPDFITEDEADLIYSDRSMKEPGKSISLDELFRKNGQTRRTRRA